MLTIKITGPGPSNSQILRGLPDDITLSDLQAKIAELTGISIPEQRLRSGFPPKDVVGNGEDLVTSLGIQSGSALSLIKREGVPGAASSSSSSSSSSASSNPLVKQLMEMGFTEGVAAKALEMSNNDLEAAFELCIGGMVSEETLGSNGGSSSASSSSASSSSNGSSKGVMVKRVVDADNSCLFNAVGYCMDGNRNHGSRLRKIIAETVRTRPDKYTEALLGKSPKEYSDWITDPKNWGGEIELFILSQYYGTEIVAVEIRTSHTYIYGEDCGYTRRIYVLYDGVHYDALALAFSETSPEAQDFTKFPAKDEVSKRLAVELAERLRQRRQFVDVAGFSLRCMVCDRAFKGQEEALAHARATNHQNFGEVK